MFWSRSIGGAVPKIVVAISTLIVLLGSLLLTRLYYIEAKDELVQRSQDMAQLISLSGQRNIMLTASRDPHSWLSTLWTISWIEQVHLYEISNSSAQLRFMGSYHREDLAPIPTRTESQLIPFGAALKDRYIEVKHPILNGEQIIGYVYLRGSRSKLDLLANIALTFTALLGLAAALLGWLLARRARKTILQPLEVVLEQLDEVSLEQDYSLRLAPSSVTELEQLRMSINNLLIRMEQKLKRSQQAEQQTHQFNLELEQQLAKRTAALRESNQEYTETLEKLHQYQQQLVEAGKISSLREMVAGIAHEVNTPIGLAMTSASIMVDQLTAMDEKFEQNQLTREQLQDFIQSCQENLQLINRNIDRTAKLITRFGQLALDQYAEAPRRVDLQHFCSDTLAALHNRIEQLEQHEVILTCPKQRYISMRPGPVLQIITQLVQNSLQHGFVEGQRGHIEIRAEVYEAQHGQDHDMMEIHYTDDGVGIDPDMLPRVFEPFVTSKRGLGATGLGLHLIYNLVHQLLGGVIQVFSDSGRGVRFKISFPVNEEHHDTTI